MRWFTSDLHFGHANIIKYSRRPFTDVEAMNKAIIDRWNKVVDDDDEVWVLGDVALGGWQETLPANLSQMRGRKVLVPGNHDRCWIHSKDGHGRDFRREFYDAGFAKIIDAPPKERIGGKPVVLSHFPYRDADKTDLRFVEHRPADKGAWLLHGHVHEKWRQRGRQINVGVDAWDYTPVSEDAIVEMIRRGPQDLVRLPGTAPSMTATAAVGPT